MTGSFFHMNTIKTITKLYCQRVNVAVDNTNYRSDLQKAHYAIKKARALKDNSIQICKTIKILSK